MDYDTLVRELRVACYSYYSEYKGYTWHMDQDHTGRWRAYITRPDGVLTMVQTSACADAVSYSEFIEQDLARYFMTKTDVCVR